MQKKILQLKSCPKQYTFDQDKACSPVKTVEIFKEKLKKAGLDILKDVKRIDTGRLDIPVYFSVCGKDAQDIIGTKKQMGKGSTPEQSRASACMELAERYSFFSFVKDEDNFITGDYAAMHDKGYPVVPLSTLLQSVHDTTCSEGHLEQLLEGIPMRWTWARNLTSQEDVLLPFSWFYAINEFNGPCAGNTVEEALLQGISEVVERHVCALITKNRISTPAIDLSSVTDPVARELIDKFEQNGIKLYVNDFSLDTGIPTIGALAWDPSTFPDKSEIVYTAGTTPGAVKALIRALTEVAQLAGDFETGSNYVASGLPKPATLEDVDYVTDHSTAIPLDQVEDLTADDMLVELNNCLQALRKNDMQVLAVDTMHPDLRIPAAYTIIPGAHFRERADSGDAPLFAAKLASELLDPGELERKLSAMQNLLPDAYYLDFYRGRNLYEQGIIEAALTAFEQALHKSPRNEDLPYVLSYMGSCLRDLQRYQEAVTVLEEGLLVDENRSDMHNILGVCYFKTENYAEAVLHFKRAVDLNPTSAIDYANLAINQERLDQNKEAITNYEIALSLDASIEFAAKHLAGLLAAQSE